MADRNVRTIRELIWLQYARSMARTAGVSDGSGEFVRRTLDELRADARKWSVITHDDSLLAGPDKRCAYCGGVTDLSHEYLVPSSLAITPKCPECDTIQTLHNKVWACRKCSAAKGTMGLYQFYQHRSHGRKKFDEAIQPLLEKKYLKVVYDCLDCARSLDCGDVDGDGELTVLDIDYALQLKGRLWNVLL